MDREVAISVRNVSKDFKLPHERQKSIKGLFLSSFTPKSFEVQHTLQDVSFDIYKGEFFGIVGRNGSGKSTLLKCMAGVYSPTKGKIKINGSLVPFIELGVGFNPELTGRDNVFLNGALLGFSRKQMEEMYDDIVEFAELEKFMDQKLSNYSSGMQVRLAFSIAIRADSDILLLDEVLAVGDSNFQRKSLDYFKQIKKTDRTIILVSHSMGTIEEFCDRALMLEDSKVVSVGDPMKISAEYEMANSVYSNKTLGGKTKTANKERPKDPEVRITKVSVSSEKSDTTKFKLDDEVVVEVEVEVVKKQPYYLSLVMNNMDGEYVAGVNTKNNFELNNPKLGINKFKCVIAPGQFPNGPYRLTINAVTDNESPEIIDVASHEFGVKLPVITFTEKSPFKKGKFYMQADWHDEK